MIRPLIAAGVGRTPDLATVRQYNIHIEVYYWAESHAQLPRVLCRLPLCPFFASTDGRTYEVPRWGVGARRYMNVRHAHSKAFVFSSLSRPPGNVQPCGQSDRPQSFELKCIGSSTSTASSREKIKCNILAIALDLCLPHVQYTTK